MLLATTEAGVLHHPENTSNHSPIFVKIDAGSLQVDVEQCTSSPRTSWTKATEEAKSRYKVTVASKLSELQVPECISCTDLHCHDHFDAIADYTIEVLESVEAAAKDSLPVSGGDTRSNSKPVSRVPGWSEFVQPYYEESKFWHSVWESAGKPAEGQYLQSMRQAKHQYKYALRRVQRASNKIQNDKFIEVILKGESTSLKKLKSTEVK